MHKSIPAILLLLVAVPVIRAQSDDPPFQRRYQFCAKHHPDWTAYSYVDPHPGVDGKSVTLTIDECKWISAEPFFPYSSFTPEMQALQFRYENEWQRQIDAGIDATMAARARRAERSQKSPAVAAAATSIAQGNGDAAAIERSNAAHSLAGMAILLIVIGLYFVPALVAQHRHHRQASAIAVLNLFLGWTILGWIISLVWASTSTAANNAG